MIVGSVKVVRTGCGWMSFQINRRSFLQGLIAAGASYALPANASEIQINQVWEEAKANPWFFELNEHGTLNDENVNEAAVWKDIYGGSGTEFINIESVINEVERCSPLVNYLNEKLYYEIRILEEQISSTQKEIANNESVELQLKVDALKEFLIEYDEPCRGWIELEGDEGLEKFSLLVAEWLQEPVDWDQSEMFPMTTFAQGSAFRFFESQPVELLNLLGVVIMHGEHPGSSYYAAELRKDIEKANMTAEEHGLPFRFKSAHR